MASDVRHIINADIIAKRGCTIERLHRYIETLDITSYTCVIILIGTIDLTDKHVWFEYKRKKSTANYQLGPHPTTDINVLKARYTNLLNTITLQNPDIQIELSPIIPRLLGYTINLSYIKGVNNMIKELCSNLHHHHDQILITSFLKSGKPDPDMNANDGLHLSILGNNKLTKILRMKVAKLY